MTKISAQSIDSLLPQTQCGECGYAGCLPYAQALAAGTAAIDRCPPGGVKTLQALAKLLDIDPKAYIGHMEKNTRPPALAVIREEDCIGCTKCIQACPVDAIVGGAKYMHTILADECTGCGLCVDPCPVDCIDMVSEEEFPASKPLLSYDPDKARARFNAKKIRQLQDEHAREQSYREKKKLTMDDALQIDVRRAKQAYILQAIERTKAKKKHE